MQCPDDIKADLATPLYLLIYLPATPTNKRSPPGNVSSLRRRA